jgi:hypothetical protein
MLSIAGMQELYALHFGAWDDPNYGIIIHGSVGRENTVITTELPITLYNLPLVYGY